jgi:hypothetical protein
VTASAICVTVTVSRPVIECICASYRANPSLTISVKVFSLAAIPYPSKFGGGISGDG